jgi:uncharacterized HAD superfamily protein
MAAKETIAVDVDDVMAVTVESFIEFSNKQWGTRLSIDDYVEDWPTMWKINRDTLFERVQVMNKARLAANSGVHEGAIDVLNALRKDYRLVITTSRRKDLIGETEEWLDKHFRNLFDEVHFAGIFDDLHPDAHHATKADLCRQIGADYLIDDHPKHCFAAADAGITSILFGDYPWNRDTEPHSNVVRAKTWRDVGEYFDAQG